MPDRPLHADDHPRPAPDSAEVPTNIGTPITLASLVVVVAALYFGSEVLIPFSLALLLSFLLAPLVIRLRRLKFNRVAAVATTVTLAFALIVAMVVFVAMQAVDVVNSLPQYQANIEKKMEALRVEPDGPVDRVMKMITRFNRESTAAKSDVPVSPEPSSQEKRDPPLVPATPEKSDQEEPKPVPVEIVSPPLTPMNILRGLFDTTFGPLVTGGIVIVFVIFILLEREDLRDRVIRLMGVSHTQISTTTQALDDAANRVSRYLLMQLVVNVLYGVPIGVGLAIIGVPNPVLWGVLATVLRFIPYLGPWIAAIFPLALAFAVGDSWSMIVQTVILYVVVELISNNFIETWLYGTSTGISSVGILLSAVFWGWLWGPIGLLMSTPLTVCIVVLGRYLPALSFFSVLLGDQPVLALHARIYQRLLALDPDEPDEVARKYLTDHTLESFYGEVLVPALRLLKAERGEKNLDESHFDLIVEHTRQLIEDVSEIADPEPKAAVTHKNASSAAKAATAAVKSATANTLAGNGATATSTVPQPAPAAGTSGVLVPDTAPVVVCLPSHDATDELVGQMLSILLRRRKVAATFIPARLLVSERLERIEKLAPRIVCISALPPYATVHARQTAKRVCSRFADTKLVVGFWDESSRRDDVTTRVLYSENGVVLTTLRQAVEELVALSSVSPKATSNGAPACEEVAAKLAEKERKGEKGPLPNMAGAPAAAK